MYFQITDSTDGWIKHFGPELGQESPGRATCNTKF